MRTPNVQPKQLAGNLIGLVNTEKVPELPFENIAKLGRDLAALPYDLGPRPMILLKTPHGILKTAEGVDLSDLTPGDFVDATHFSIPEKEVLRKRRDLLVMIGFRTPYVSRILSRHGRIRAGIDDFAQIIGKEAPAVLSRERDIAGALTYSYGVLIDEGEGYALVASRNLYEAYLAVQIMEKGAEIQLKGTALGGIKPLTGTVSRLEQTVYHTKYSKAEQSFQNDAGGSNADASETDGATSRDSTEPAPNVVVGTMSKVAEAATRAMDTITYRASKREKRRRAHAKAAEEARRIEELADARQALVDCGKALTEENILQGTWGNLSVRLRSGTMLTTPSGLDYRHLEPEDMVIVDIYSLEYTGDNKPTSEKALHAGIYALFPEAGAVIHTHAVNTAVYAACRMPLEVEDPALAGHIGSILPVADYGFAGTKKLTRNVLDAIGNARGCILANHGMICWGTDLDDAVAVCKEMEQAAEAALARRLSD